MRTQNYDFAFCSTTALLRNKSPNDHSRWKVHWTGNNLQDEKEWRVCKKNPIGAINILIPTRLMIHLQKFLLGSASLPEEKSCASILIEKPRSLNMISGNKVPNIFYPTWEMNTTVRLFHVPFPRRYTQLDPQKEDTGRNACSSSVKRKTNYSTFRQPLWRWRTIKCRLGLAT